MLKTSNFRSKKKVRVNIRLEDGTFLDGHVFCALEQRVSDLLNDEREFLPFESMNEDIIMLRKGVVSQIQAREESSEKQISSDPYKLLGLERGATRSEIREAYHDKVRAYHPDRIISLDLPEDMTDYANDMLSRINAAYESLMQQFDAAAAE